MNANGYGAHIVASVARRLRGLLGVALLWIVAMPSQAIVIYDETASGDLADGTIAASVLTFALALGSNEVRGDIGGADAKDHFEFIVPEGFFVNSIEFDNGLPGLDLYTLTPISGFDVATVIGSGTPLLSGNLIGMTPSSGPILGPLSGGRYGMTLKADIIEFELDLFPIPEPASATLLVLALALSGKRRLFHL